MAKIRRVEVVEKRVSLESGREAGKRIPKRGISLESTRATIRTTILLRLPRLLVLKQAADHGDSAFYLKIRHSNDLIMSIASKDQRSLMFSTGISKLLSLKNVCVSHHIFIWVTLHTYCTVQCVHLYMFCSTYWVLGTCVLTRCHVVTDINYVDRGAAARAPLQ